MKTIFTSNNNAQLIEDNGTTVIANITANALANGASKAAATEIPHSSHTTIALVHATSNTTLHTGVRLPSGANIGDVVEVYVTNSDDIDDSTVAIYPPTGEQYTANTSHFEIALGGAGLLNRKIDSITWGAK